jgi:hypothetical protein
MFNTSRGRNGRVGARFLKPPLHSILKRMRGSDNGMAGSGAYEGRLLRLQSKLRARLSGQEMV